MIGTKEQANEIIHYMLDKGLFPQVVRVATDHNGDKLPEGKYFYGFSLSFAGYVPSIGTDHIADLCEEFGLAEEIVVENVLKGELTEPHIVYRFF